MNKYQKICPVMSTPDKEVPCNENCAWFCNDGIPSMCMIKDIAFSLSRIEQKLSDIHTALPD